MTEPLTARAAQIRLAQYGKSTKTWSTATYDSGTEKTLHEIALALNAEVERLTTQRKFLLKAIAKKDARSGEADAAVLKFLGSDDIKPTSGVQGEI